MVIFRPTVRAARGLPAPETIEIPSDGALGDWYLNRITIARRPYLLMVSSTTLLSILTPARGISTLPARFPRLLGERLVRLGVAAAVIEQEVGAATSVRIGRTRDRSVVGTLVEYTRMLPDHRCGDELPELADSEDWLAEVPSRRPGDRRRYLCPDQEARLRLESRWTEPARLRLLK